MACCAGLNNAMDETRAGVKERPEVPVIDLSDVADGGGGRREVVVEQIRRAAESWGLFQVVGHGVPATVLDEMMASGRRFHEGDPGEKAACNAPDDRRVSYTSHLDVYPSRDPNWRDSLFCCVAPNPLPPEELPAICREAVLQYWRHVSALADTLFQLLSEALGLGPSHLEDMECHKGCYLVCHYYPDCPEADLTLGTVGHCDTDFLTILLQDDAGGLQLLHQDRWVDVPPLVGALVVNLGDLMQLITNDRFKSAEHKVLAKKQGTRVSVGCFFTTYPFASSTRLYGPIKELLSDDNPARYMETSVNDYARYYKSTGLTGESALSHFKL